MPLSSIPLTDVDAFTASLFPPLVGSAVNAEDVQAGEQVLANRTRFLFNHGRIVGETVYQNDTGGVLSALSTVSTSTYAAMATLNSPSCQIGDLLVVDFSSSITTTEPAGNVAEIQLNIQRPDLTLANPAGSTAVVLGQTFSNVIPMTLQQLYTVTQAGVQQVQILGKSQTAQPLKLMSYILIRILQVRP